MRDIILYTAFFWVALGFAIYVIPTALDKELARQDFVAADTYQKYGGNM